MNSRWHRGLLDDSSLTENRFFCQGLFLSYRKFLRISYKIKTLRVDAQLVEMKFIASQCLRSTSVVAELMSPGHHATLAREDFASEILFYLREKQSHSQDQEQNFTNRRRL